MDPFSLRDMFIKTVAKNDTVYGVCCGVNMVVDELSEYLKCEKCGNLVNYIPRLLQSAESQKTQHTSKGKMFYGIPTKKTKDESVKELIQEFKLQMIKKSNSEIDDEAVYIAAELMYEVCHRTPKKRENRPQIFAACLSYACRELDFCLTDREIVAKVGLKVDGISKGETYLMKHIVSQGLDISLDKMNYENIIVRHLKKLVFEYQEDRDGIIHTVSRPSDTPQNISFCSELVQLMLEENICHNMYITTKIAGSIRYWTVKFNCQPIMKKKDIAAILDIGQHTMMGCYNILANKCQHLLPEHMRL